MFGITTGLCSEHFKALFVVLAAQTACCATKPTRHPKGTNLGSRCFFAFVGMAAASMRSTALLAICFLLLARWADSR